MKIGFIGLGVMGKSMARNLKKAGFAVSIFARNPEKVQDLVSEGFKRYETIKELVVDSEVVITIVGYPSDVREVYFDADKIIANAKAGTILMDMTTSSPTLAKEIHQKAKDKNIYSLDCPVTGGDLGAKNGTLTIFVGGEREIYEKALPVLEAMGKVITFVGAPGSGQHAKLANQIAIAGAISAVSETIAYAKANGLDPKALVEVWGSGSAGSWQMSNMAPRALNGDLQPGFFIKHFIKDMNLAIEESEDKGLYLKMLKIVRDMFQEMADRGYQDLGTQAIIDYYK
ncbi:MAG TPA: NAD(P)-dependent oxidoreductase [Acholeplasmataceae bacterium]|nr:NAD(P)-dependent oxidoreductase [Acholeplasmataceae bacterium]